MKYRDPDKIEDIMKEIVSSKTVQHVNNVIKEIYPEFILHKIDEYSKDYPHFDVNWRGLCLALKVKKAYILIVDEFSEDDEHILIKTFCEIMTQAGFIIRKKGEFFPCSTCGHALPTEDIDEKLKELNIKVPEKWDTKCTYCF
jgi:hypothetical protein